MKIAFASVLLIACGGAATTTQKTADVPMTVTTTATPVAPSPPLFTGAFDIVSMTDPNTSKSVVIAEMLKQAKAHDGRMTWAFTPDSFTIGFWQVGELDKLADADKGDDRFATFCRTAGTAASHWEGSTLVLASTIKTQGEGVSLRIAKTKTGAATDRRAATQSAQCSASFAATRITFEIVDKDEQGPTKLRAKSDGVILDLVRGKPQADIAPDKLFD